MKNLFLFLPVLIFAVGCDAPQRTRAPISYSNGYSGTTSGTNFGTSTGTVNNGTTGSSTGGTTDAVTSTPGFESCNLGDKYQNIDVGWFGLCQSSQDETVFKFRTSIASTSSRVCLIPTYKDAAGSSTYIGSPQCTYTQANTVYNGKLYKDRSGFSSYSLNGVMVMKETLVPEYVACMQGYINWPANACQVGHSSCYNYASICPYGGGNVTGSTCDTQARNYMNEVCNSFKSKYTNGYTDLRLK